ncbi:hypothetical protein CDAR_205141 [Caerostris darwini]|uniref:Uncharacterized protein n=1 Tax=Caerostris darwini TaxID=1538125 RepID=A0AAV4VF92_9ARAC|nr:hypothetical protein CDAR_205141 [Caerostris darwini]
MPDVNSEKTRRPRTTGSDSEVKKRQEIRLLSSRQSHAHTENSSKTKMRHLSTGNSPIRTEPAAKTFELLNQSPRQSPVSPPP